MRSSRVLRTNLLVLLASLPACNTAPPPAAPSPAASAAPSGSAPPPVAQATASALPPAALPAGVPDTPAGHQLAWVLASMNSVPAEADIAPHFAASFLAKIPPAKLVTIGGRIAQGAPYALEKVTSSPASDRVLKALVRSGKGPALEVVLMLEPTSDKIESLLFRPHSGTRVAASWDEVLETLRAAAPSVNFLAAEISAKTCVPVSSLEPKKPLALGSAFKLYVLDALAAQIAAGKHRWEESVAIDDRYKSLPSGPMRDEAEGATFPVRHFAERMISVSDNTAADHLIAFVGRTAVEGVVKASGHASPSRLVPFFTTRELFALKLLASPEERSAYVKADEPHRRKLLEGYGRRDPAEMMAHVTELTSPVMVDSLEWFASPEDLCKVMVDLHARAGAAATAPVGEILSINPGIPDEKKQYQYIGYKGGSEPGVLNMTYVLQRARDGKWLFLTAGFNDAAAPLDESKVIAAVATAREYFGR